VLLRGLSGLLVNLYKAGPFFERALRSLERWHPRDTQKPPNMPVRYQLRVLLASMWKQGVRSNYRRAYWRFLRQLVWRWSRQPAKLWLGFMVLLSAHHFVIYSQQVAGELELEAESCLSREPDPVLSSPFISIT
jgi:hypothetical protein